ncbi:periplasmic beta-glucosidase [Jatropha curcas]|uniref:periplasmic beta-glucosidase n=1 Tax=Jatropha curcas TaxID=180498 RepID=UPI001892F062|nr:periplasmic beta-glucosidase [Jatropha curcas]
MDSPCIYKDPNAPVEARVKDLLSRMTLKEKVAQMTQIERRFASPYYLKDLAVGSVLNVGGSGPFENALSSDWADMVDGFQKLALDSRLGIPIIYGIDAVHGNNGVYGTTIFPHNVGLGATRDSDLVRRIGVATALEVRASGIHYTFAPCVAVSCCLIVGYPFKFCSFGGSSRGGGESKANPTHRQIPALDTHTGAQMHRELAREAVRKSLVLLKNGKDPKKTFLPLDKNAKKILVTGTHADDLGYQCGGWTITWDGLSGRITIGTTILDAIKRAVGETAEVVYEKYPSPETLACQDFSYAIVAVGEGPYAEFTGDNSELVIPFDGTDVISSVADRIPTLAILISGRPLVLEAWLLEKIDAFVAAWLPGTEGSGITDVIFGDYEFKGRLPVTWFKKVEQLPMNSRDNSYDPLFPFGFGLTYNGEKSLD